MAAGATLLAVDSVGAGVSERVLVVIEGRAAGEALGQKVAPVDAAIIGIVDQRGLSNDDDESLVRTIGAHRPAARTGARGDRPSPWRQAHGGHVDPPRRRRPPATARARSRASAAPCAAARAAGEVDVPDRAGGALQPLRLLSVLRTLSPCRIVTPSVLVTRRLPVVGARAPRGVVRRRSLRRRRRDPARRAAGPRGRQGRARLPADRHHRRRGARRGRPVS